MSVNSQIWSRTASVATSSDIFRMKQKLISSERRMDRKWDEWQSIIEIQKRRSRLYDTKLFRFSNAQYIMFILTAIFPVFNVLVNTTFDYCL